MTTLVTFSSRPRTKPENDGTLGPAAATRSPSEAAGRGRSRATQTREDVLLVQRPWPPISHPTNTCFLRLVAPFCGVESGKERNLSWDPQSRPRRFWNEVGVASPLLQMPPVLGPPSWGKRPPAAHGSDGVPVRWLPRSHGPPAPLPPTCGFDRGRDAIRPAHLGH